MNEKGDEETERLAICIFHCGQFRYISIQNAYFPHSLLNHRVHLYIHTFRVFGGINLGYTRT